jgi:hypothetical protein
MNLTGLQMYFSFTVLSGSAVALEGSLSEVRVDRLCDMPIHRRQMTAFLIGYMGL